MAARLEPVATSGFLADRFQAGAATQGERSDDRPISVALLDDRALGRRALRSLLNGRYGFRVIGDREPDELELTAPTAVARPDVLVLELHLPAPESIVAVRSLAETAPSVPIVVLCAESNPLFVRRALDAGARGYVLRDSVDRELAEAVSCAAGGRQFISPNLAVALQDRGTADGGLTRREIEVLRLTALGFTGSEIAGQLRLSRRTVESHRATIHRKLGLGSRAELVSYAIRRGLLAA
jgi:DNA-binding NarL/FixJ family response regulator